MTGVHFGLLVSRIMLDSIARLLLLFVWFHSSQENFCPITAALLYYLFFLILLIFNIIFNTSKISLNADYVVGLLMNSWSSVLSYNHYDYSTLLGQKKKDENDLHQSSLIRQVLYNLLCTAFHLVMTVWTVLTLQKKGSPIFIKDSYGDSQEISHWTFYAVLIISWVSHIMASVLTIFYYLSHPSRVTINPREKCHIWCLGRKYDVSWLFFDKEKKLDFAISNFDAFEAVQEQKDNHGDETSILKNKSICV